MVAISTYAGAITLGEYKGEGNLSVVKTDSDNKKTSYQVNCNVAYNIENTESTFELPFGVVQCNAGMETWNERSYSFKKEGINYSSADHLPETSTFKPASGTDSYQISRQEKGESLEARYFKPHSHCASTVEYSVHAKESSLKMTVRKSTTTP